jgi:D-proline reductase (dithiol) PrdB
MGVDDGIRGHVAELPVPVFDPIAATVAPPLDQCRVAIVTTAALRTNGHAELAPIGDPSFVTLPRDARDLQLAHFSPNFDRSGLVADLNVVYPVDRLAELEASGVIGSRASQNLAFMGAQFDLSTVMVDTGPAAAQMLLADGVDVVLLTPV